MRKKFTEWLGSKDEPAKLDNFIFNREGAVRFTSGDEMFIWDEGVYKKWLAVIDFLICEYEVAEWHDKDGFSFIAYGSPFYGVIDGKLMLVPLAEDFRVAENLIPFFKSVWGRINKDIKPLSIPELYDLLGLNANN